MTRTAAGARTLVVVNPAAGQNEPERLIRGLAGAFAVRRAAFDLVETERAGHATELARAGAEDGYRAVVAVGGDGTVAEVVAGLAGTPVPLGIVPRGTGNQLAANLGIPADVERAVEIAVRGRAAPMDLGQLEGGRYFAVAAGAGWDASVMHSVTRPMKERWGYAAYVYAALRTGVAPPVAEYRVTADGTTLEVPASMVLVANMAQIAARLWSLAFHVAPGASHQDGLLDVVIFAPRHLPDAAALLWGMTRRSYPGDDRLIFLRAREVRVECRPAAFTEVDGEPLGVTPLAARAVPEGIRVLLPA